jgi:kinesin family protein 18/19
MFEATLRAVSERRSDRLDDISVDNVEMDARWRNTDMERMKAEAERDVLKDAVESQAEMVVNLVGIVGRCTVMIGEAGRLLRSSVEEGRDGMEGTVRAMAASLKNVTEKNEAFTTMIGHSTVGHMRDERSALAIDVFKGHPTSFMRISSVPHLQPPKPRSSRRSLSYGGPGSPCRTPRKSLRSSISQPYRRVSDKEKDKKSVQWRDEVGQGDLDDGRQQQQQQQQLLPAPPQALARPRLRCAVQDQKASGKTDDSPNLSFLSSASADNMPLRRLNGVKRPRPSQLDPGFLKPKRGGSMMLGSLTEDDENTFPVKDRSTNQLRDSQSSNGSADGRLHIPKRRERHGHGHGGGSPARRVSSTPRIAGVRLRAGGDGLPLGL